MRNLRVAYRYAEALISTSDGLNLSDKVGEDLIKIQSVIKGSHEFQLFLKNPVIKKEKKQQVLEGIFGRLIQPFTLEFLSFLVDKEREEVLPYIIDAFFLLRDEGLGIVNVDVKSASTLSKEQIAEIEKRFEFDTKKKVRIKIDLDKRLIGGFIAKIGDTVFDGSVKRQLELLRRRFTEEISVV